MSLVEEQKRKEESCIYHTKEHGKEGTIIISHFSENE